MRIAWSSGMERGERAVDEARGEEAGAGSIVEKHLRTVLFR
jgi:hypothetical protein